MQTNAAPETAICLVGSKIDMQDSRCVSTEEGAELALKKGWLFCEVSAKANENVKKPFIDIVNKIVSAPNFKSYARRSLDVDLHNTAGEDSSACQC